MSTLSFGPLSRIVVLSVALLLVGGIVAAGSGGANEATGTLEGEVVDEIGEPIEDAEVDVDGVGSTKTDERGKYKIEGIPDGEQDIEITASGYEDKTDEITVSTTNSPVTEDYTLDRTTGTISGTASSSGPEINGDIPGVKIEIEHKNETDQKLIDELDRLDDSATTDDDDVGEFSLVVPTGEITLNATQDGFDTFETTVTVDADDTKDPNIDMEENLTSIEGVVTNTNGESIEDATVEIENSDIWPDLNNDEVLDDKTDSDGEYEIDNVPVSTTGELRTIEASASSFEKETNTTDISESGETIDFELSHDDETLDGTVEDEYGNPLNNIEVSVDGEDSTTTDEDGEYGLDVSFGTHDLTVEHPDYADQTISTEVRRNAEDDENTEDFELERTSDVRLSIDSVTPDFWQAEDEVEFTVSFDEEVYEDVEVSVDGPDGDSQQVYSELLEDDEDGFDGSDTATGSFTIDDGFDDGQYTLSVSALGETESQTFTVSNIVDAEGASFSEPEYRSVAGDFVEVSVDIGDQDEAYILIGGDRDSDGQNFENYLDVLHVDGGTTFIINTRLVGTDRDSDAVYIGDGVTSYAHSIGADSEPQGEFAGVSFQNEGGNEIASTLAEFRDEMGFDDRSSPLQTSRYRLVAGGSGAIVDRDGVPNVKQPIARSNLVLTQPEIGEVTTYTLPPGAADEEDIGGLLGDATEADLVARGDRILIEVQASGMFGALMDENEDAPDADEIPVEWVQRLLDRHEGVSIELRDSELAGPNRPGADLRFSDVASSDLYVLPDDTADQWEGDALGDEPVIGGFYIVIDTRGSDPFDGRPTDGDELTFEIAYESPDGERYQYQDYSLAAGEKPDPFDPAVTPDDGVEHFPYFGSRMTTVSANSSFVFEYPTLDYGETTLDDELLVAAEDGGVITGETNLAPGSQAEIQLVASNRPDPRLITIEDIEIDEDRSFEVTGDFSAFEPGERVEVEFHTQGRLTEDRIIDKRGVRVVDDLDNPATFEITDHTESAEVMRGTRLSDIEATITNTGDIADRQQVRFEIDGEGVKQETVTLDSGESRTLDLSESFVVLSPGEYSYTIRTDDDEQTGQLTVTEADDETAQQLDSIDTEDGTLDQSPEDTGDDEDPEGLFGLIGIQRRDIAVAATVTGAMHILGQWT